ncbi:MAG: hypothetical protein GY822_21685 [Deltaproteobacteria bacterium]|nr:hypothetical protein [Deltaproteobacteria bacterium]
MEFIGKGTSCRNAPPPSAERFVVGPSNVRRRQIGGADNPQATQSTGGNLICTYDPVAQTWHFSAAVGTVLFELRLADRRELIMDQDLLFLFTDVCANVWLDCPIGARLGRHQLPKKGAERDLIITGERETSFIIPVVFQMAKGAVGMNRGAPTEAKYRNPNGGDPGLEVERRF